MEGHEFWRLRGAPRFASEHTLENEVLMEVDEHMQSNIEEIEKRLEKIESWMEDTDERLHHLFSDE